MDVDLLRPGTVPISPDTSLWFEFLLDASHLEKHLKNPNADPTPTDLIIKFLTLYLNEKPPSVETLPSNGLKSFNKRCMALKILSLKVAAYLKWNLNILEKSIPVGLQAALMKDLLLIMCPHQTEPRHHLDLVFTDLPPQALFALTFYHRWVVRGFMLTALTSKKPEQPEEISEAEAERSAGFLLRLSESPVSFIEPTMACFSLPTEDADADHVWTLGNTISVQKMLSELLVDLAQYFVSRTRYTQARHCLEVCLKVSSPPSPELIGLCMSVGLKPSGLYSPSLPQQFHEAIADQYVNIDKVLERDNVVRQIPIAYRQLLELDIASEVANGKLIASRDAVATVRALNSVRAALDGAVHLGAACFSPQALAKASSSCVLQANERERLRYFLLYLLASSEPHTARELASNFRTSSLLSTEEISAVIDPDYIDPVPVVLQEDPALPPHPSMSRLRSVSVEIAGLEKLIMTSYTPSDIRSALLRLLSLKPSLTPDKINKNWDVPVSLQSLLSLPNNLLRNYTFVLLAKSYELDRMKNWGQARALLRAILEELGSEGEGPEKLQQLINQEILLVDIHQCHADWPRKHLNWSEVSSRCQEVMMGGGRGAVKEGAALALLNMGSWSSLAQSPPSKSPLADLYVALSRACLAVSQFGAKVSTETWDKVVALFCSGGKRREMKTLRGLSAILEPSALAVVISLLSRLYNVLNDQPPLDLHGQLAHLWPGTIKNASQYNLKQVSESLYELLEHALTHYPYNLPWLKLLGDLYFVNSHHRSALRCYLEAAAAGTDHFSRPLHRTHLEDTIIKRMIKSCQQLLCHTQAGVLCQFLEEADYSLAYKCLSEPGPADASDAYHCAIWDVTILEFLIAHHSRKGEQLRKQQLIRIIGLLELNANNNDEIKREAENIRKSRFLRAMASQYL